MAEVVMYTKNWCPYCVLARRLLVRKGVEIQEKNLEQEPDLVSLMIEKSGGMRTVPQIFIGSRHVGGYNELVALEREGSLDELLSGLDALAESHS